MQVVRKSKYRHVYANKPKNEDCWSGFRLTKEAWDQNFVAVNPFWIAIPISAGGGSGISILNARQPGRLSDIPMLAAHRGAVMNLAWNPFHDSILASASADCTVKIWQIPEGFSTGVVDQPAQDLTEHSRKIGTTNWNPVAENVLATSSADYTVKVWDVVNGAVALDVAGQHGGLVTSTEWNYNGSLIATACKDKHLRVIDPRTNDVVADVDRGTAQGPKGNRVIWLGKSERILSCGFGRSQRQYTVYDLRDMSAPFIKPVRLDSNAGGLIPHYDMDTDILFLGGKGDSTIQYFELDVNNENPKSTVFRIDAYSSTDPQNGLGFMPKRGCDVNANEIARLYKITQTKLEPLSFTVPRKNTSFADDIFIPCSGPDAALTTEQWLGGENSDPATIDLSQGYVPVEKEVVEFVEVVADADEPQTLNEYKAAYRELKDRVAYLEAELARLQAN